MDTAAWSRRLPTICLLMSGSLLSWSRALPVPVNAATLISQTYNMALHLQESTAPLLNTYNSLQGTPFSDPGFNAPEVQITNLPQAAIPYRAWRALRNPDRLKQTFSAYTILSEFMQLVLDQQQRDLNPSSDSLFTMLKAALSSIKALLTNVGAIMEQMGVPIPVVPDPLMASSESASAFQKKVRGYVVCREYKNWVERTTRDFKLLKEEYPIQG